MTYTLNIFNKIAIFKFKDIYISIKGVILMWKTKYATWFCVPISVCNKKNSRLLKIYYSEARSHFKVERTDFWRVNEMSQNTQDQDTICQNILYLTHIKVIYLPYT